MNEKEQEFGELNLEDIMKEFADAEEVLSDAEESASVESEGMEDLLTAADSVTWQPEEDAADPEPEEPVAEGESAGEPEDETSGLPEESADDSAEEPSEEPEGASEEPSEEASEEAEDDTIRLDDLSQIPDRKTGPANLDGDTTRLDSIWENEQEETSDTIQPPPIAFRPKQRLRELKRKLIAGPEKRYYELSETGLGKLQTAIAVCILVVLASVGAGFAYSTGMIPENRTRLMVFSQVLAMLLGALMGSQQMIEGVSELLHGKFTMNTMLTVTFFACCADSVLCLQELRVPICAAFTLEVALALWAAYHRRTTEMGQMDTLRKAVRLDSVCICPDYYEGKAAYLRGEGQVEDFMDNYSQTSGPEKLQSAYAVLSILLSAAVAVLTALRHNASLGVQIFSTSLLVAVPAGFFVTITRPMAMLERRLHSVGTVLCGWKGLRSVRGKMVYPVGDQDIFPEGSSKMNGVKFYGDRDPEVVIAYAASLMRANGGGLEPVFEQLLAGHNGIHYTARNVQFYANGGVGGEVNDEPVLMGSLDFLKDMGVEIPDGTMVKQAVYLSIDGELSGLFAVSYTRTKYTAKGMSTLNGNRKLKMLVLAEDFMLTGPFLKEKFGVNPRRLIFLKREERKALSAKTPAADAPVLAMTTQEGLAPAAYAVSGARALRTAWRMGLLIHVIGGLLGLLIMAALGFIGSAELLTPFNVLLYQLVWLIPGILVTMLPRTV